MAAMSRAVTSSRVPRPSTATSTPVPAYQSIVGWVSVV